MVDKKKDDDAQKTKEGALKHLTAQKLTAFERGINLKTPFQKAKEEAEARRRKEMEEASAVYQDFVASFDDGSDGGRDRLAAAANKSWVRGQTIRPSPLADEAAEDPGPRGGDVYKPSAKTFVPGQGVPGRAPAPQHGSRSPPSERAGLGSSSSFMEPDARPSFSRARSPPRRPPPRARSPSPPPAQPSSGGRKRNLDTFMEELKREQEERDRRNRRRPDAAQLGSHDTGDGTSTNLYVGNLSPSLDEPALCREFGRYGAIASIKIMWPRNREERERGRNCGFVSFMDRQSAEKALKDMDGREVAGFAMRVGWGKPVPIPDRPYFVLNANQAQSAPAERTGLPFGARLAPGGGRARVEVPVRAPADAALRWRIHRTVERAVRYGPDFEAAVVERERGNETGPFAFLFDFESPEHVYYRWKLYSVLQGEPPSGPWRTTPFEMYDEGPAWSPPRPADADAAKEEPEDELVQTTDSDTDSVASEEEGPGPLPYRKLRGADRARLSPRDRRKLVLLLRRADLSRGSIAKAMAFCVDRADAAEEVVDLVVRSLLLPGTPVFPGKIARLYVLSDLLHNASSSVHNAWKFRALVQPRLAAVFAHLGEHWRRIPARLKAEQMRRAVMAAVEAWETWIVFPREQVEEWKAAFKGTRGREGEGDEAREELDGEPMDDVDGVPMEDVDGVPLDAPPPSKFAPIGEKPAEEADDDEDLDGAPIGTVPVVSKFVPVGAKDDDEEEDLDGLPMGASAPEQAAKADDDEDLDGVPM